MTKNGIANADDPPRDTWKRWRLRFSVRTVVVVLTLACCYAACWGPTTSLGVFDVIFTTYPQDAEAIAPLLVAADAPGWGPPSVPRQSVGAPRRCYYFWFFGTVVKLPFERDVKLP